MNNDCNACGKCNPAAKDIKGNDEVRLYTILIYSENIAGLLSLISAVFTRRQVNIESLNVCASSIPGVHKYTITCNCTEEMAEMLTKQIEKKIDVIQANYFTDDEVFFSETALLKISTPVLLEDSRVSKLVRQHSASIIEVNPTYATVQKTGMTEEIFSLYHGLKELGAVVQFTHSGRICITRSTTERLDEYLAERENKRLGHNG